MKLFTKRICYIVLAFNNYEDTINTLKCIQNQKYQNISILCIDNGSRIEFIDNLRKYCISNSIEYIYRDTNDGYTGGNNYGWKITRERGFNYICICNNDILFDDIYLTDRLIAAFGSNKKIGVIGTNYITKDGKIIKEARIQNFFIKRILRRNQYYNSLFKSTPGVMGCFIAINSQAVITDYLFEESFFMYADETDFEYRLINSGWYVGVLNDQTTIIHLGGNFDFREMAIWKIYLSSRNSLLCAKIFSSGKKVIYIFLMFASVIWNCFSKRIITKKKIAILSGFLNGCYIMYTKKDNNYILRDAFRKIDLEPIPK